MKLCVKYLPHYRPEWESLGYRHEGDAGFDLRAAVAAPVVLAPGAFQVIPTGVCVALEPQNSDLPGVNFEIQVRPRSGLAAKHGISVVNTPGTIDFHYRGEIKVVLINLGDKPVEILPGDRMAQAVVAPVLRVCFEKVDALPETARQSDGFGSTGVA